MPSDELRKRHDLLPIMFDFDPLAKKTTIETLMTLAHMSRFVIADLTEAKAVLQELTKIVDNLRSLPIKLIIHESGELPSMSDSFLVAESVLEPYVYRSREALLEAIGPEIIEPANARAAQLEHVGRGQAQVPSLAEHEEACPIATKSGSAGASSRPQPRRPRGRPRASSRPDTPCARFGPVLKYAQFDRQPLGAPVPGKDIFLSYASEDRSRILPLSARSKAPAGQSSGTGLFRRAEPGAK